MNLHSVGGGLLASFALGVLIFGAGIAKACFEDLVKEEARTRLERLPYALIMLAALRAPREVRSDLREEWIAELRALLADPSLNGLPITRLKGGLGYALGLLWCAHQIARQDRAHHTGLDSTWYPQGAFPGYREVILVLVALALWPCRTTTAHRQVVVRAAMTALKIRRYELARAIQGLLTRQRGVIWSQGLRWPWTKWSGQ